MSPPGNIVVVHHTTLKSKKQLPTREVADLLSVHIATARRYMHLLEELGLAEQKAKSPTDPTAVWTITQSPFWVEGERPLD
ncbi:MAG: helix-turn-helix domain-containing protein [Actinomycetota bacterium]